MDHYDVQPPLQTIFYHACLHHLQSVLLRPRILSLASLGIICIVLIIQASSIACIWPSCIVNHCSMYFGIRLPTQAYQITQNDLSLFSFYVYNISKSVTCFIIKSFLCQWPSNLQCSYSHGHTSPSSLVTDIAFLSPFLYVDIMTFIYRCCLLLLSTIAHSFYISILHPCRSFKVIFFQEYLRHFQGIFKLSS